ncbi:UNVERIFIED_CONTAM: hypothetical protein HDU68_008827 [Siphonaria sp. JEL0065]|nr:hypothetical protein HDU68_008827 [Siphonaria sp. JEL0065]
MNNPFFAATTTNASPALSRTPSADRSHAPGNPFLSPSPQPIPQVPSNSPSLNPFNPFTNPNTNPFVSPAASPTPTPAAHASILNEFDPLTETIQLQRQPQQALTPLLQRPLPQATTPLSTMNSLADSLPPPYPGAQPAIGSTPPDLTEDELLAIQIALGEEPNTVSESQIEADEALARQLEQEFHGYVGHAAATAQIRRREEMNEVPTGGNRSTTHDDEALARILQEEEDSAFAQREGVPGGSNNSNGSNNHNNAARPSPLFPVPPVYSGVAGSSPGIWSEPYFGNPSHSTFNSLNGNGLVPSGTTFSTPPTFPSLFSQNPNGVGKPFHEYGFGAETTPGSRFQGSTARDFDVCFWGRECITVMEGNEKRFYVNLMGDSSRNRKWVMQREDHEGMTLYILSESVSGKGFALFDTELGKVVGCTKTKPGQLSFSTITHSDKLAWKDTELRVVHQQGLFAKKPATYAGRVPQDNDLMAYVVRTSVDGALTRMRIRVGGRGLSRADFVIASFIGMMLLDRHI